MSLLLLHNKPWYSLQFITSMYCTQTQNGGVLYKEVACTFVISISVESRIKLFISHHEAVAS